MEAVNSSNTHIMTNLKIQTQIRLSYDSRESKIRAAASDSNKVTATGNLTRQSDDACVCGKVTVPSSCRHTECNAVPVTGCHDDSLSVCPSVCPSVHLSVCLRIRIPLSLSSLAPHSSVKKGEGTRGKAREREKTKRRWALNREGTAKRM